MSSPGRHRTASCHPRVGRDEGMPQAPEQDRAAASSPSRTRSLSNTVPPGTARPMQQGGQRHQVPDDDDVDVVRLSADLDGARPTPPGHRPGPPGHQHRTPLDGFNAPQVCRSRTDGARSTGWDYAPPDQQSDVPYFAGATATGGFSDRDYRAPLDATSPTRSLPRVWRVIQGHARRCRGRIRERPLGSVRTWRQPPHRSRRLPGPT